MGKAPATRLGAGPTRTCVGCRQRKPQAALMRLARSGPGRIGIEAAGARRLLPGRGAYVCPDEGCISRALRSGAIARALKHEGAFPQGLAARLATMIETSEGRDGEAEGPRDR